MPPDQASSEQATTAQLHHQNQMDLNLLSSENYNEVYDDPGNSVKAGGSRSQVYGGLLTRDRQPSPPRIRTRTRKGSKKDTTKALSPDETARQRGRPRLDTKDQTPAERRRTQIRLAQRAYRQRKETTISGLNKRVLSLERTIQDMHKAFLDFQDEANAVGLRNWNPALAGNLHRSAATFAELAKNGIHESDAEGEEMEVTQADEASAEAGGDILSSRDMRPQLAKHESDPGQQRRQPRTDAGLSTNSIWGYSPTFQHLLIAPDSQDQQQHPVQEIENVQMQNWDAPNAVISPSDQNFQLYPVQVPETFVAPPGPSPVDPKSFFQIPSFISNELPLPRTFSNAEKSFARRLVRRSLEAAIQLLTSPSSTPEEIGRFCKFTFCYSNRSRILNCLKNMVGRDANENLEFWHVPFYHEGGSGLHFPRVGIDATSDPPENWASPGPVGPTFQYTPETDHWNGVEKARVIQELGIDGEWFDSNDVEQYLRTKGIYLNGESSIVEITEPNDVPELGNTTATAPTTAASPSNTHSSVGGPQSPYNDFVPTNAVIYGNEELFNTDPLGYDDAVPDVDLDKIFAPFVPGGATKAINPAPEFDFNLFPQMNPMQPPIQTQTQPQVQEEASYFNLKAKKYVDVERLIDSQFFLSPFFPLSLLSSLPCPPSHLFKLFLIAPLMK